MLAVKIISSIFFALVGLAVIAFDLSDMSDNCANEIDRAYYREQRLKAEKFVKEGNRFLEGDGVERDYEQARQRYNAALAIEDAGRMEDARYKLAYMYQHGLGVPRDYAQATKYYGNTLYYSDSEKNVILMAESGSVEAQNSLGDYYYDDSRKKEAMKWYQRAAAQGSAHANSRLGMIFDSSSLWGRDEERAVFHFKLAARQGDKYAQEWLEERKNLE